MTPWLDFTARLRPYLRFDSRIAMLLDRRRKGRGAAGRGLLTGKPECML